MTPCPTGAQIEDPPVLPDRASRADPACSDSTSPSVPEAAEPVPESAHAVPALKAPRTAYISDLKQGGAAERSAVRGSRQQRNLVPSYGRRAQQDLPDDVLRGAATRLV